MKGVCFLTTPTQITMELATGTDESRAMLARLVSGTRVEDHSNAVSGMSRIPGSGPSVFAVVVESKYIPSSDMIAKKGPNAGQKFTKKESIRVKVRVLSIENVTGTLMDDMGINDVEYDRHRREVSEKLEARAMKAIASKQPLSGPLLGTRASIEYESKKSTESDPTATTFVDAGFGAPDIAFDGRANAHFGPADHAQGGVVTQVPDEAEATIHDFPLGAIPAPDPMSVFIELAAPDVTDLGSHTQTFPTHAKLRIGGTASVEISEAGKDKLLDLEKGNLVKISGLRPQKPYYMPPTFDAATGEKKFAGGWFTTFSLTIGMKSTGATQSELYSAFGSIPCEPIPIPPIYIDGEARTRYDMPVSVSTEPNNPSSGWRDTQIVPAKSLEDHKESFCRIDKDGNFKSPDAAFLTMVTSVIGASIQTAYVRVDARDMVHFLLGDPDIPKTETTSGGWNESTVRKWCAMTWCLYGKEFSFSSRGHVDAKGSTTISDTIGGMVGDGDAARKIDTAVSVFSQTFSVKWDKIIPTMGIKTDTPTMKHLCGISGTRNSVDDIRAFARGHKGRFFRAANTEEEKLIISASENDKCNYTVEIYMLPTVSSSTLKEMRAMPLSEASDIIDKCLADDTDSVPESVKNDMAALKKELGPSNVFNNTFFARIVGENVNVYDVDSDPVFSALKDSISSDNERRSRLERLSSGTMIGDSPESESGSSAAPSENGMLAIKDDATPNDGQLAIEPPVAEEEAPVPQEDKNPNKRKEADPSPADEEQQQQQQQPEPKEEEEEEDQTEAANIMDPPKTIKKKPHKSTSTKEPRREKKKPRV